MHGRQQILHWRKQTEWGRYQPQELFGQWPRQHLSWGRYEAAAMGDRQQARQMARSRLSAASVSSVVIEWDPDKQ